MAIFEDPVEATIGGDAVLWLGTESDSKGIWAVVVDPTGLVSLVRLSALRANFRRVGSDWINGGDKEAALTIAREKLEGITETLDPSPAAQEIKDGPAYPPGTIYDSEGNPYTADGDPLPKRE